MKGGGGAKEKLELRNTLFFVATSQLFFVGTGINTHRDFET